jgi:alpha-L-rhamnosidase
MKLIFRIGLYFFSAFFYVTVAAQSVPDSLQQNQWNASWIQVPGEPAEGYGVYLFRRTILLNNKPDSFIIHVSADNRYKLFVNGEQVSLGPARGDLEHWYYETLDIAAFLQGGKNSIAALVWNEGPWRPEGQISLRTGFILQADGSTGSGINTNGAWKCIRDSAFGPLPYSPRDYYVAGPGEQIEMKNQLTGWEKPGYNDSSWKNAELISPGVPKNVMGFYGTIRDWMLVPSGIPAMELKNQRGLHVISSGNLQVPGNFPAIKNPVTIPAYTKATFLLDQGFLTNAYPELIFSGGRGGMVSLTYAEALYTRYPEKGNRNETAGKIFLGRKDSIISNGGPNQIFTTLDFRTYRYIELEIKTSADPLVIEDIRAKSTGYPFQLNASITTEDTEINKIFETGWRTARLCAMETYMDCPYYEQLQYIGDARIQALISLYNSGDERLLRNAMNQMDNSRRPEGITLSRHPSYTPQYIPTFSLLYIGMLHDYMMYGSDSNYIQNKLAGERQILTYYRNYQQPDGSVRGVPYWMFTDWVGSKGWTAGVGPVGRDGNSALIDLQLLWAYQLAADMENRYGMSSFASRYTAYAEELKKTIRSKYWNQGRKLFADRSEKDTYSQHANALAILTGMFENDALSVAGHLLLSDTSLAQASIYFKFYLHMALVKAGLGNDYLNWLDSWRENLKMGMTTWAESPDINTTRSDCHAWGASPNIEFFRTVLGIDSDSPGFSLVKIEPHLGPLQNIQGEIPHARGKIKTSYILENNVWDIKIELPSRTSGRFIWRDRVYPLTAGANNFKFKTF